MTLTRATLGKLAKRQTKDVTIGEEIARIQKPTPLEHSQYTTAMVGKDREFDIARFPDAVLLLVARMWIDDEGDRLFKDSELKELGSIDLEFYQRLSEECQLFARGNEASETLGESEKTTGSDSRVESA